jgi:hypothetical protein
VHRDFTAQQAAAATLAVYEKFTAGKSLTARSATGKS